MVRGSLHTFATEIAVLVACELLEEDVAEFSASTSQASVSSSFVRQWGGSSSSTPGGCSTSSYLLCPCIGLRSWPSTSPHFCRSFSPDSPTAHRRCLLHDTSSLVLPFVSPRDPSSNVTGLFLMIREEDRIFEGCAIPRNTDCGHLISRLLAAQTWLDLADLATPILRPDQHHHPRSPHNSYNEADPPSATQAQSHSSHIPGTRYCWPAHTAVVLPRNENLRTAAGQRHP